MSRGRECPNPEPASLAGCCDSHIPNPSVLSPVGVQLPVSFVLKIWGLVGTQTVLKHGPRGEPPDDYPSLLELPSGGLGNKHQQLLFSP